MGGRTNVVEEGNNAGKESTTPVESTGGMGAAALTDDPRHVRSDLALVHRAIARRWVIPSKAYEALPAKMLKIVEAETVEVKTVDKDGNAISMTVSNSRAQVSAAKVLAALEAQNQTDDHAEDKNQRLDSGKNTEQVGHAVKYIAGVDPGVL